MRYRAGPATSCAGNQRPLTAHWLEYRFSLPGRVVWFQCGKKFPYSQKETAQPEIARTQDEASPQLRLLVVLAQFREHGEIFQRRLIANRLTPSRDVS